MADFTWNGPAKLVAQGSLGDPITRTGTVRELVELAARMVSMGADVRLKIVGGPTIKGANITALANRNAGHGN